jgi:PAS domain S-box-containing protein
MSTTSAETNRYSKLRVDAETRLKEGSAPPTKVAPISASALTLLHKLASTPESAHEALKLLHELQVHQVELDLQHEQTETTVRELAEGLAHYKGLYEHAPSGYFIVARDGKIIDGNLAGAGLFGVRQDELRGRRIDRLVAPESRPNLIALLKRVGEGGSTDACEVKAARGTTTPRMLRTVASATPSGESLLMVFVEIDG